MTPLCDITHHQVNVDGAIEATGATGAHAILVDCLACNFLGEGIVQGSNWIDALL